MKVFLLIIIVAIAIIFLEILLRLLFGFGNPLLYVADAEIGYLLAPNQTVRRFGNRIMINEFSMRSGTITLEPTKGTKRVLMIGDSIVNGGWWTDQKDILSEVISRMNSNLEVLNASANSWAPRNELAYIKRYGIFNTTVVVLVINTDDLFGTVPTSWVVGRDRNYPDRKPTSAIAEVITRYLLPAPAIPQELKAVHAEGGDRVGANLEAIRQIHHLVKQNNAQFILAMTPLLREVEPPGSRDYEQKARQRLLEFTQAEAIEYIDFLGLFQAEPHPAIALYQDHIHLSEIGNQLVSQWICKLI
jgi:hypothetical protein